MGNQEAEERSEESTSQESIGEMSEEDKHLAETCQKLASKDKPTSGTCMLLVIAQQLYHCGLGALRERLKELDYDAEEGKAVETHLINSMSQAAMKPFHIEDMPGRVEKLVLPWLAARATSMNAELAREQRDHQEAANKTRAESELPFGYETGQGTMFNRFRPVVFAGRNKLVEALLLRTRDAVHHHKTDGKPLNILHFTLSTRQVLRKKTDKHLNLVEANMSVWARKGGSHKGLSEILMRHLRLFRDNRLDLMLIEDLSLLAKPIVSGAEGPRTAAEALTAVRKCAKQFGCGVLAGMPLSPKDSEEKADFQDVTWSRLNGSCDLRWVNADGEEEYDEDYERHFRSVKIGGALTEFRVDDEFRLRTT